jgi:hypothetical protein
MIKRPMGDECKFCFRVYNGFNWKKDKESRYLKTTICNPCANLKNICTCCLLDIDFGITLAERDSILAESQGPPIATLYETEQFLKKMNPDDIRTHAASTSEKLVKMMRSRQGENATTKKRLVSPMDKNIKTLYISGLDGPELIEEKDIRENFEPYGKVTEIKINRKQDCAFITFQNRNEAELTAESLYNRLNIKGTHLKLLWAKPKKKKTYEEDDESEAIEDHKLDLIEPLPISENTPIAFPTISMSKTLPPPPGGQDTYVYSSLKYK